MKRASAPANMFLNFRVFAPIVISVVFVSIFFRGIIQSLLLGMALSYFLFFLGYILYLNLEIHLKSEKRGRAFFYVYVAVAILMFVFALNSIVGFLLGK